MNDMKWRSSIVAKWRWQEIEAKIDCKKKIMCTVEYSEVVKAWKRIKQSPRPLKNILNDFLISTSSLCDLQAAGTHLFNTFSFTWNSFCFFSNISSFSLWRFFKSLFPSSSFWKSNVSYHTKMSRTLLKDILGVLFWVIDIMGVFFSNFVW